MQVESSGRRKKKSKLLTPEKKGSMAEVLVPKKSGMADIQRVSGEINNNKIGKKDRYLEAEGGER